MWTCGQRFEISPFYRLTTPAVDQQTIGDGREKGHGLAQFMYIVLSAQHADKRVVSQIFGIGTVA